ncbi:hypothetical protein [Streptomyces cyaneofuscatus]|uniref:hypothetical protein n=1 Tax=Streptomyces cyaneofuscatus TaxID=66883 RepID=UPI0036557EAE
MSAAAFEYSREEKQKEDQAAAAAPLITVIAVDRFLDPFSLFSAAFVAASPVRFLFVPVT